ncbi:MAG: phytanoyl-CoA dioxygenase family protein [Armatimonadetes bacterium]|nr:phytanoyl-CoA dioxygenase family protein [Armatimonadota bacterium]
MSAPTSDREAYLRDGYLIVPNLFSRDEVMAIKAEMVCLLETVRQGILDILEGIFAPNLEFLSDKIVFKAKGTAYGSPWHQDWHYWHGSNKISLWLALDDATPANGCMKLLPGSHTAPIAHKGETAPDETFGIRLKPGEVDESQAVIAEVSAGGGVFFLDLTLHASYPNSTGDDRWAWIGTYRDAKAGVEDYDWAKAREILRGEGL